MNAGLLHTLVNTRKTKLKAISLVTMHSKEIWLVQENHATANLAVKLDSKHHSLRNENLQWKQKWTVKSTNLKGNAGNVKSVFVNKAALWAQKNRVRLDYCRSWKNTLRKLAAVVNLEAVWFKFWTKGVLAMVEILVFCGWWFSNQFDVVLETHFSCSAVGRPWAMVSYNCSLGTVPWSGLEDLHQKARLCVYFNWF